MPRRSVKPNSSGRRAAATSYLHPAAGTGNRSNASKASSALALSQSDPRLEDPTGAVAAKAAARNYKAAAIGASPLGGLRLRPRCGEAAFSFTLLCCEEKGWARWNAGGGGAGMRVAAVEKWGRQRRGERAKGR